MRGVTLAGMRPFPVLAALALLLAACGGGEEEGVRIFAAASLQHVLPDALERWQEAHPEVEVTLQFNGSQALATQIEEGAEAALFLSANPDQVDRLEARGLVERRETLLANRLVVAVEEDSSLRSLDDLGAQGVRIAVGAPAVPVGALTGAALARLDPALAEAIRANVVTEDPSVRIVLSRVETGEADAAFVYHTDIARAEGVRAIEFPADLDIPRNRYVAAIIEGAGPRAGEVLDHLLSAEAQAVFAQAGFIPAAEATEAAGTREEAR